MSDVDTMDLDEACREARRLRLDVVRQVRTELTGAYASAFHGAGSEFRDFRPYVAGDDLRRMDWLVTARRQSPYVRRYVEERELRVVLAVDLSTSMRARCPGGSAWRTTLQAAAALALAAAWNRDRVCAFGFSAGVDVVLPARAGERHALSIVRNLLACPPRGRRTDPAPVLQRIARVRRNALVLLLTDLALTPPLFAPEMRGLLAACAGRHSMTLVSTAPPPPMLHSRGLVTVVDPEEEDIRFLDAGGGPAASWADAAQTVRDRSAAALREFGIPLVALPPGPDCARRLAAGLRRVGRRRRSRAPAFS